MSVFGDFQRVWVQRFPESALPAAWEEDVRANLAKHKQKVAILREELEKEEFYVEYLETLLSDVEKHKATAEGIRTAPPSGGDVNDLDDKASDSKQGSNTDLLLQRSDVSLNSNKSEDSTPEKVECEPVQLRNKPVRITERSSVNQCINELSNLAAEAARRRCNSEIVQRTDINHDNVAVEQTSPNQAKNRPTSQTGDFVTVIEVNGLKLAEASKKSEESQQSSEGSPVDPVAVAKKKVPPKPPPKVFSKRGASLPETGLAEDSPPSSLGRRIRNAESRESIASRASTPSISERVKSYESINSLSSERKRSGGAATPRSIDEEGTSTTPDLGDATDADKSAPISLESIPAAVPGSEDEPYYDQVPVDINDGEYVYIQAGGTGSSTEDGSSGTSTLPLGTPGPPGPPAPAAPAPPSAPRAPDSPLGASAPNYVNIHYFLQKGGDGTELSDTVSELADSSDTPLLLRTISSDTEASATPPALRKLQTQESSGNNAEAERLTMHRCIITSIIESETVYVECLYVMEKYMNAIKATLSTSQPVITEEEFNTIFYKISELHELHKNFLEGLKAAVASWEEPLSVGIHFKKMAENINIYGAFLHNYGRATDAVRRRCSTSQSFAHLTRQIACHGQPMSLDDLLHKPVARVQKNALVLHDLIKYTPASHPDHAMLTEALNMTQHFLDEFNIIQTKSMFPNADRAQRRLVKNSFIVELSDGHRKLRHLFLFNDVIACAKYKASGRDKFTFELKWFIPLPDIVVVEDESAGAGDARETSPANIVALKSQASTARDQILAEERAAADDKKMRIGGRGAAEKQRKKLAELEAQLVLASPNLVFRVGARAPGSSTALQRQHIFFLSSEYERTQWIDSIHALQASSAPPAGSSSISMLELQAWVTACRSYLQTDMGSYLLRSGRDDSLLLGDLQLHVGGMTAPLDTAADYYIVVEVDSYGHYFRKAKSKLVCRSAQPRWNESFTLDLEGSQNLRLLLYEDAARPVLRGKCTIKLSREWVAESAGGGVGRTVCVGGGSLTLRLRLLPPERSARRVPSAKPGALFGNKITHVAKREKRNIPFIISACVREVERRGIHEVGVYRVSGSASDLNRLKKSFETNAYEAEQLLKEVDIHSVTGVLKLYLRELPEALFTDALYPELLKAWGATQGAGTSVDSGPAHTRRHALLKCYAQLPDLNKNCIDFLLNHFVKVNQHESENKMSMHNLATVFGPTLLRPGSAGAGSKQRTDLLAAGTVDAMAQAGILYCLLQQRQLAAQLSSHHRAPHSLLD